MGGTYSCSKFRPPRNPRRHPEKGSQPSRLLFNNIQGFRVSSKNHLNVYLTSVSSVVDAASFLVVVAGVVVVVVLSFFFLLFFFFVVSSSTFSVVASFSSDSSFRGGDPDGLFSISLRKCFCHNGISNRKQTDQTKRAEKTRSTLEASRGQGREWKSPCLEENHLRSSPHSSACCWWGIAPARTT